MMKSDDQKRPGFTLIELLVATSVIGALTAIVIVALNPQKNLLSAYDAQRQHHVKQVANATYDYLIDRWKMPGAGAILEGVQNAKPICKSEVASAACLSMQAVPMETLPPEFISALPVDPAEPTTSMCIGYSIYQQSGRMTVIADHMGKLPGEGQSSCCVGGGDPYIICTCQDLMNIPPDSLLDYELGGPIFCANIANFTPIGGAFGGVFDGKGLTISDLTIVGGVGVDVGLFESIALNGEVRNVTITDAVVTSDSRAGILTGVNNGLIDNVHVTGTVAESTIGGGLVGDNTLGTINNSSSTADVHNGDSYVGGLVGSSTLGAITNSFATGDVSSDDPTIDWVGGLVGFMTASTITNSYATGDASGVSTNGVAGVAGLVGHTMTPMNIINSYATGKVTGPANAGGVIGFGPGTPPVNSYWFDHPPGPDDNATQCVGSGGACPDVPAISDLYNEAHAVYTAASAWDFATIWQSNNPTGYPTLR